MSDKNTSSTDTGSGSCSDAEPEEQNAELLEVASRILAAQIIAGTQHQTASAIWQQQKEVIQALASCLSDLFPNNKSATDSLNQLQGKLRLLSGSVPYPSTLGASPHGSNAPEIAWALRYAENLIQGNPPQAEVIIHAEQLFEPGVELSDNQIHQTFADAGWVGLAGKNDYNPFIQRVDEWYTHWLNCEEPPKLYNNQDAQTLERAKALLESQAKIAAEDSAENYKASAATIRKMLWAKYGPPSSAAGDPKHLEDYELISHIYCGEWPADRLAGRSNKAKRSNTRKYRPWALFSYFRQCDDDSELAMEIRDKVRRPFGELKSNFRPLPLVAGGMKLPSSAMIVEKP